jgi:hypothetical protein
VREVVPPISAVTTDHESDPPTGGKGEVRRVAAVLLLSEGVATRA